MLYDLKLDIDYKFLKKSWLFLKEVIFLIGKK